MEKNPTNGPDQENDPKPTEKTKESYKENEPYPTDPKPEIENPDEDAINKEITADTPSITNSDDQITNKEEEIVTPTAF